MTHLYEVSSNGQTNNIPEADGIVARYLDRYPSLKIFEGTPDPGAAAHYQQAEDKIVILPKTHPEFEGSQENWYRTLFHELTHSTGHYNREDRLRHYNQWNHGVEELIAELGSTLLTREVGMRSDRTGEYLNYYLDEIGRDPSLAQFAVRRAEEATQLILGRGPQTVTVHAAAA